MKVKFWSPAKNCFLINFPPLYLTIRGTNVSGPNEALPCFTSPRPICHIMVRGKKKASAKPIGLPPAHYEPRILSSSSCLLFSVRNKWVVKSSQAFVGAIKKSAACAGCCFPLLSERKRETDTYMLYFVGASVFTPIFLCHHRS